MVSFLESRALLESFVTLPDVGAGNNVCGVGHAAEAVRWHVVAEVLRRAGFEVSDSIATGPDLGAICVVIDDLKSHEISWPVGDVANAAGELRAVVLVEVKIRLLPKHPNPTVNPAATLAANNSLTSLKGPE